MMIQNAITETLIEHLQPVHLEVVNESSMHSVPPGSETHFKVVAVSDQFQNQSLVARHRAINHLLSDQLKGPIHALSIHALTPEEWDTKNHAVSESPQCLGGSKKEQRSSGPLSA